MTRHAARSTRSEFSPALRPHIARIHALRPSARAAAQPGTLLAIQLGETPSARTHIDQPFAMTEGIRRDTVVGIAYMLFGVSLLPVMNALAKSLTADYPLTQVV